MAPPDIVTEERASEQYDDVIIKKDPKRKWVSYIWDTFDKSPEERKLLFKLDTAILTFASLGEFRTDYILRIRSDWISLGYFIKYLDQININNAFVSGMYVTIDSQLWTLY